MPTYVASSPRRTVPLRRIPDRRPCAAVRALWVDSTLQGHLRREDAVLPRRARCIWPGRGGSRAAGNLAVVDDRPTTRTPAQSWSWHWKMCLTGLAAGLSLWFPSAWLGTTAALATAGVNALVYALAEGLLSSATRRISDNPAPASALRWSFDGRALALGLLAGPAVGLVLLLMDTMPALLNSAHFSLADHPGNYIYYAALYGLGVGLAASLHVLPADEGTSQDPATSLAQDHSTFRRLVPITAVAAGLGFTGIYTVSALGSGDLALAPGRPSGTDHPMEHLPLVLRARVCPCPRDRRRHRRTGDRHQPHRLVAPRPHTGLPSPEMPTPLRSPSLPHRYPRTALRAAPDRGRPPIPPPGPAAPSRRAP